MTIFGMNVVKGLGGRGGRGEFLIETLVFLLIAFAVLELISHIFVISSSGFDLTDEGFYMLWMSNPSSYKISISQFGYLLQPIYKLANGDIYIIRVINYSLTVLIATALALAVLFNSNSLLTFIRAFVLSSAIGCSALLITFFELPQTPSYNTLLFQVFLLGACALIFIDSKLGLTRGAAIALLAFSLVMAFLLKPTAAAVFGVLALGHIVVTSARRVSTSIAIAMIAIIVFILFVCSIDDSFGKYISRITDGLKAHYLLVTGAAPFPNLGVVLFPLGGELLKIFLALLAMLLTTLFWVGSAKPGWRPIWIGICVIGDLIGIFALNQNLASIMPLGRYAGVLLMVVPFAAIIWLTITGLWREISLKNFSLSILFFILPFAYAFGTERPLWLNAQGAAIFWVLSAFVLLASVATWNKRDRIITLLTVIVLSISSILIKSSSDNPHRQTQSLRLNSVPLIIGNGQILMSNDFVAYIVGIKKSAQDAGFVQGTSVIDLTGSSPGTVFILNGLALKTPWLLGGYDGSKNFAKYYLDKMSCEEISQSWLLIAPDGPGKIPEDVLHPFGLDIKGDYQDVGQASRPLTPFPQHHSHHLLKPYSVSRATARCENIKKNENKE